MCSSDLGSAAAANAVFADLGVGGEFRAAQAAGDVTTRIRAINLAAWHRTYMQDGWKALSGVHPSPLKAA